ncbi:ribonuclease PH [bacterium]|nr:ribonuclease PH [bacterium]
MSQKTRADGRNSTATREILIRPDVNPYAEGSAEVRFGNTLVHCTVSIESEVPKWLAGRGEGWITAEYGMLPRSTHTRSSREAATGKQSGRTQEIQRLIGRALRQSIDLKSIPDVSLKIDCDVICADGGTRTAAISGSWVALARAIRKLKAEGKIKNAVQLRQVGAISVGQVAGNLVADLDYLEDSQAEFDMNVVAYRSGELIEVQGTAERAALKLDQFNNLVNIAFTALDQVYQAQDRAIKE